MQIALHTAQETCQSAAHFHCCKSTSGVETCQSAKYSSRLYKTIWELQLCSFTNTRVHVEWLRVKGEKKSSSHAHLCQPTSLGSFGSSRRNGPSRAVIAVAVLWKYFFLENYPERDSSFGLLVSTCPQSKVFSI